MKQYLRLKIEDPDKFMDRLWIDDDGTFRSEIEEGEIPPRFPNFSWIE